MSRTAKVEQVNRAVTKALDYADSGCTTYPPYLLIVSDSPAHALELKRSLETHGCQVSWTDANSAGLATACRQYFDVIVLDLERPGANCFEVCKKLKAKPELSDIPVVVLMAHDGIKEAPSGFKIGKVYCLSYAPMSTLTHPQKVNRLVETKLLPVVEQILYLSYRYL